MMIPKKQFGKEPSNQNAIIWRYMDFTKFIWLLETNQLYFTRSDKFEDPFEGTLPPQVRDFITAKANETSVLAPLYKTFMNLYPKARKATYINCWHTSECESAAMWGVYSHNCSGIAIQSRYNLLRKCFDKVSDEIFIGEVSYHNYSTSVDFSGNTIAAFYSKRESYEHEKEVRAIMQDLSYAKQTLDEAENNPFGKNVSIQLNEFIEKIYVDPKCAGWFYDCVVKICKRYNLKAPVIKSDLLNDPII